MAEQVLRIRSWWGTGGVFGSSVVCCAQAAPATPASVAKSSASAEPYADSAILEPLGPGAIAHVAPNEAEHGGSQDAGARVQQHLQRLQQLQQTQSAAQ